METAFFFEQAAVGISKEEFIKVWLSLKHLVDTQPLQHVRFWGKIIGIEQNYYIAEVEYREGEQAEDEEEEDEVRLVLPFFKKIFSSVSFVYTEWGKSKRAGNSIRKCTNRKGNFNPEYVFQFT